MIPRIIHYIWLSGEEYPEEVKRCIESWKVLLGTEYRFVCWDYNRVKDIECIYLHEALAERKWAFASDYLRIYALYYEGGIYLDSDVLLFKNFDILLNNEVFIGRENSWHLDGGDTRCYLTSHCIGSIPGHEFLKKTLDYYENIHFSKGKLGNFPNELRLDMTILPYVQAKIAEQYGYNSNLSKDNLQVLKKGIIVYPSTFFDPEKRNQDSVLAHLALGSWRERRTKNEAIDWKYKIRWRIVKLLSSVLHLFGYTTVKIT